MTQAAAGAIAATQALDAVMRSDRGRLLAALIARLRNFQLAEEALQEATISAMTHWGRTGLPDSPQGWLLRVALRKAIDRLRSTARDTRKTVDLTLLARDEADDTTPDAIPDERLQLIFTCCHPALDPKSRVALTLRTLGGLSTIEIARAFLDQDATMGQRISRAKTKITQAGIPFVVPGPEEWPDRLGSVLTVIYLIFNEGYAATSGEAQIRASLCEEAIFLARLMSDLTQGDPEVAGLLSLMLSTHASRPARTGADGALIPLDTQDRALWDAGMITEGLAVLDAALLRSAAGPYQIKAAMSALHAQASDYATTDWRQMLMLYDSLLRFEATAVVRLNRAVVMAQLGGIDPALDELDRIGPDLIEYQPYHAALADLLSKANRFDAARRAYERAVSLSGTQSERDFLQARRDALPIRPKKSRARGPAKSNREV